MKRIKNEVLLDVFSDDKPLQAAFGVEKKSDGSTAYETDDEGRPLRDPVGNKVPKQILHDLTTAMAIRDFLVTAINPHGKEFTIDDADKAFTIMGVLRPFKLLDVALIGKQPETIDLETAEYDWLIKMVKEHAPKRYGARASIYRKAVENLETVEVARSAIEKDQLAPPPANGQRSGRVRV